MPRLVGSDTGDDRVRHCALCEKNVYDLAGLTAAEAVHLLAEQGEKACVRLHRRRDGTILTADCDVGRRRRRKSAALVAAGGALVVASAGMAALPSAAPAERLLRIERSPRYQSNPHSVFYPSPPPAPDPNFALYQGLIDDVVATEAEPIELDEALRDEADSALERDSSGVRSRAGDR